MTKKELEERIDELEEELEEMYEEIDMAEPKWLYRLESTDPSLGLWYSSAGEWCLDKTLGTLENNKTKELPMDYDWRYKQDGNDWWSSCSNLEDLSHWYSREDAEILISQGFRFSKYLAVDYREYEKETIFLKETCLDRKTISINEVFYER